jgi:hypothetical protein
MQVQHLMDEIAQCVIGVSYERYTKAAFGRGHVFRSPGLSFGLDLGAHK